jgi:hypothetical protein
MVSLLADTVHYITMHSGDVLHHIRLAGAGSMQALPAPAVLYCAVLSYTSLAVYTHRWSPPTKPWIDVKPLVDS